MYPCGYLHTSTLNETIATHVAWQRSGCFMLKMMRERKCDWDDLVWKTTQSGNKTTRVDLLAGEFIHLEEGWEIDGPVSVYLTYLPSKDITRVRYKPLPHTMFDLDNPLEYPCAMCGAQRGVQCIGDNTECAYRVFFMKGGLL
jgi:hypothetical protein